jgi:hypothetical protein
MYQNFILPQNFQQKSYFPCLIIKLETYILNRCRLYITYAKWNRVKDTNLNSRHKCHAPCSRNASILLTYVFVESQSNNNILLEYGFWMVCVPVREGDPLVAGDDAVVDGENGLGVHPHPGHLHPLMGPYHQNCVWDRTSGECLKP